MLGANQIVGGRSRQVMLRGRRKWPVQFKVRHSLLCGELLFVSDCVEDNGMLVRHYGEGVFVMSGSPLLCRAVCLVEGSSGSFDLECLVVGACGRRLKPVITLIDCIVERLNYHSL